MATKITDSKPVTREIELQGMSCNVTFDEAGITISRKGDKHRDKRSLTLDWDDLMDSVYLPPDADVETFTPTGWLNYEDE